MREYKSTPNDLNGRFRAQGGRKCCVFGFAFIFLFIFILAFSSRGVRETDVRGCVFTFPFAFAFTFALSFALFFALSFALGRDSNWSGEVGVIIKEREAKRA